MKAKPLLILCLLLLPILSVFLGSKNAEGTIAHSSTLVFDTNEDDARCLVIEGSYMYALVAGINPARVIKIQLSTFTEVNALTLDSGSNGANSLASDGTYLYAISSGGSHAAI